MKSCPICNKKESRHERVLNGYHLLRCQQCNFVFADIDQDLIERVNARHDDQFVDRFEETQQSPFEKQFFLKIAKKYNDKFGPARVLDVGCGTGLLLSVFKEMGWDCVGVDLSSWTERYAKQFGFKFYQGRLEDLQLDSNDFDLVVSTSTLEHIADPLPHVKEIFRVVKPGGVAYFSGIPNYNSISIRLGLSQFVNNMPPDHPNYFTPSTLRALLRHPGIGGEKVKVKTYGIPGAHQGYFAVRRLVSGKKEPGRSESTNSTSTVSAQPELPAKSFYKAFLVSCYLGLGRTLRAGTKLEAEVCF